MLRHSVEKVKRDRFNLECETCHRVFHAANVLALHMKSHYRPITKNVFNCDHCNTAFGRRYALQRHVRSAHSSHGKKTVSCALCNQIVGSVFALRNHMKSHLEPIDNGLSYACTTCGKVYQGKSGLRAHQKVHSGLLPYMCDICGKAFREGSSLQKHYRIHTGAKPYKCKYTDCGKSFSTGSSLVRHHRVHSGEKPYVCDVCGKKFTTSGYLNSHLRVHEVGEDGSVPMYQCTICYKSYRYLDQHMKRHLKDPQLHPSSLNINQNNLYKRFSNKQYLSHLSQISFDKHSIVDKSFSTKHSIRLKHQKNQDYKSDTNKLANTDVFLDVDGDESDACNSDSDSIQSDSMNTTNDLLINDVTHKFQFEKLSSNDIDDVTQEDEECPDNKAFEFDKVEECERRMSPKVKTEPIESIESFMYGKMEHSKYREDAGCSDKEAFDFDEEQREVPIIKSEPIESTKSLNNEINQSKSHGCSDNEAFDSDKVKQLERKPCLLNTNLNKCNPCEWDLEQNQQSSEDTNNLSETDFTDGSVTNSGEHSTHYNIQSDPIEISHALTEDNRKLNKNICLRYKIEPNDKFEEERFTDNESYDLGNLKQFATGVSLVIKLEQCDSKKSLCNKMNPRRKENQQQSEHENSLNGNVQRWENINSEQSESREVFTEKVELNEQESDFVDNDSDNKQEEIVSNALQKLDVIIKDMKTNSTNEIKQTSVMQFKCDTCGICFKKRRSLGVHRKSHKQNVSSNIEGESVSKTCKKYVCDVCGKVFKSNSDLQIHKRIHTGELPYVCHICGKACRDRGTLKKHSVVHSGEKSYECTYCDKKFGLCSSLTRHIKIHTGEKRFICEMCGFQSSTNWHLQKHMQFHGFYIGEKPVVSKYVAAPVPQCNVCGKFVREIKLHLKLHMNDRQFHCTVCDKSFTAAKILQRHIQTHTGIKPFKCSVGKCDKAFTQKGDLVRHEKRHDTASSFQSYRCTICVAFYNNEELLKHHLRLHNQTDAFVCETCKRPFKKLSELERHAISHTGEKLFNCDVCGKTFSQKGCVTRHKRVIHNKAS